jgi:hypothetical protein
MFSEGSEFMTESVNHTVAKSVNEPAIKGQDGKPATSEERKKEIREFWDAVLQGGETTQFRMYKYIRRAVAPLATGRTDITADSLVQIVAQTLFRRATSEPTSLEVSDFEQFRRLASGFGRKKLLNEVRKRDVYKKHVKSLPVTVDDQGAERTLEPAAPNADSPLGEMIVQEWSESFIEAVEGLPEPDRTIMRTALEVAYRDTVDPASPEANPAQDAGQDAGNAEGKARVKKITYRRVPFVREVHQALKDRGVELTEAALRMRIRRVGRGITDSLEGDGE